MMKFENLDPELIWTYFGEICSIPRPSGKEEKIIKYLEDFAVKHKLGYQTDSAGNVLMVKPATKGMENRRKVILQSHLDMVCEKNSDVIHDFERDGIQAYTEKGWVKAKGTTLGADDGIGIAAQLAILSSPGIPHGPVECLFTVDEETGLTGANAMEHGLISGKILLNLDSEDEGELFIGCAGGMDTIAVIPFRNKKIPPQHLSYEINVKGLTGGHSGDDIHKGVGNSVKILNRFLWYAARKFDIRIARFDGGNLRNAIPREAGAIILVHSEMYTRLAKYFKKFSEQIMNEFGETESNLSLNLLQSDLPAFVINKKAQFRLLNALYACPHGVISWSREMKGLVETSTNLASVKFSEQDSIVVTTSQRSSVDSAKADIANQVSAVFRLADAEISHSTGYPGWKPNLNSEILRIAQQSYMKLFGTRPEIKAIHAGLECGLFLVKYPDLDMISFGPTIKGAHSPEERLEINSVGKFWELLLEILKNIPAEE